MQTKLLGTGGPRVSTVGLGCMAMSGTYGPADDRESLATIHAALDAGITLLDTGDFYGMGHNEMLLAEALRPRTREQVVLSVKFGALRDPAGGWTGFDARPAAARNFLAYTLKRLRTDYVDIYRPARLDPQVPIEETVGALSLLVKAGYVRYVGLSEVNGDTLGRAHAVHPICDVQLEYSLLTRGIETTVWPVARTLGIAVTAYGVLSRGLLGGGWTRDRELPKSDFRRFLPRFAGKNLEQNLALIDAIQAIAHERQATVAQVATAWVLAKGADVVPLCGARTRAQLADALSAIDLILSAEDVVRLEAAAPASQVAGTRYDAHQMRMLDSER